MATDPSQNANFLRRIACLLRRRLLGSPTGHPVLVSYFDYESVCEPVKATLARYARRALLDPFAKIKDARQAWKVIYLLREVLFLVCGTIASGDDYDDIVDSGTSEPPGQRRTPLGQIHRLS